MYHYKKRKEIPQGGPSDLKCRLSRVLWGVATPRTRANSHSKIDSNRVKSYLAIDIRFLISKQRFKVSKTMEILI